MLRLEQQYRQEIIPKLKKELDFKTVMQVPRITKITLNMGVGEAAANKKVLEYAVNDMRVIAGQQPIITRARKSVAGFKIREGWPIGCKVTLRDDKMYSFLDRLINIAMPRVRDFRGLSVKSFDKRGNYSLGIKEQIVFPEINYDTIDKIRGFDVVISTSARTDKEAYALLSAFNFPFKDKLKEKK